MALVWEQRKWSDTVDISTEMVNPTTGEYDNMPHIAPGNIESFTGRILDNVKSVKEEQLISGKFRFRPGDVVYGKINPQLGKYFYASVDGLTSADAYVFNGKNGVTQKFLFYLLQTQDFFKYSVSVSKRSGMPKINRDELNAYSFLAPEYKEQEQMGDFLFYLDNLITLHQRKDKPNADRMTIDWEQRKFGKVFSGLQNNTLSRAEMSEQGTIKNVHYGDVLIKYGSCLDASNDEIPFIADSNSVEKYSASFLQDGDIIIADTAEDTTVGKCTEIQGSDGYKLLSGLHTIPCRPNEKYAPGYMGYYMNSAAYHDQLIPLMQGIKVTSISKSALQETDMMFPKNYEEQKKIGSYLQNLDHLITLHQCKCVIEGKFTIFDWEQRKLGDICQVTMGQSPDGSTYSDEPSDYILVQGNADLKDGWVYPRIWTTQKTKTAQAGDLIMSVRAPAGAMGKTAYDVVIGRGVAAIKGNEFIYQSLVKYDSDGYWKKLAAGSTFESVNSDAVKGAIVNVPQDIEEQNKIGEYFKRLDALITLHQQKEFKQKIMYNKDVFTVNKEKEAA